MAGHSKWANIRHKKEKADAKKGKIFSQLAKEIITAVKIGGEDPKNNPRLRLVLSKCKEANMPSDNITRNIKKATSVDQSDFESVLYELYGHEGVGVLVEMLTDNKNRSASDMRIAINKNGGSLANPGSVSFNFEKKGVIQISRSLMEEDALFTLAIDAGASDFEASDEHYIITTEPELVFEVKEKLEAKISAIDLTQIDWIPKNLVECGSESKEKNLKLISYLEDLEDTQDVWHNMDL